MMEGDGEKPFMVGEFQLINVEEMMKLENCH